VWGERYSSEIIAREPPKEAKEADWEMVAAKASAKIPDDVT
jgi:hypothetical protein